MTPGDLLYTLLTSNASTDALLGQRVYPLRIPEKVKQRPALVYQQVGGTRTGCNSYGRLRYQLTLHATTYTSLETLADAVRGALDGYEQGQIYIQSEQELDGFDNTAESYSRMQDYFIDFPNPLTA